MWQQQPYQKHDVEAAGSRPLYPSMTESPDLRWSFIRKIYSIVTIQLLATIAVAAVVVTVHPIAHFFVSSSAGLALYIVLLITPFIVLCPLYYYHQRHPVNFLLLGIFTITLAFGVGLTCAFTSGKVILEATILTAAVVISLTFYTFWAARRGHDFNFLGPFLFGALIILILFAFIQGEEPGNTLGPYIMLLLVLAFKLNHPVRGCLQPKVAWILSTLYMVPLRPRWHVAEDLHQHLCLQNKKFLILIKRFQRIAKDENPQKRSTNTSGRGCSA